jgi:hypothetical protein
MTHRVITKHLGTESARKRRLKMKYRKKMKKGKSRKLFRRTAGSRSMNRKTTVKRGGNRL